MKVTVNVECSPEEARAFLGLPDVSGLQQEMLAKMKEHMEKASDPQAMMKALFPQQTEAFMELQKTFWDQLSQATRGGKSDDK